MEIKLLTHEKTKALYLFKNAGVDFANALRRTIVSRVPTMAIEDIEFSKNSSVLYDEIIAHRLGLVPLVTDLKSYAFPKNEEEAESARCQLKFTCKVKGPKTVYSEDLVSQDPKVIPVYPKMIITKLLKGQELEFVAKAILGRGDQHSKWAPGLAYYKYVPVLEGLAQAKDAHLLAEQFPQTFELKGGKLSLKADKYFGAYISEACLEACEQTGVKVTYDKEQILFFIESFGQLSTDAMLTQAVDALEEDIVSFEECIKKI